MSEISHIDDTSTERQSLRAQYVQEYSQAKTDEDRIFVLSKYADKGNAGRLFKETIGELTVKPASAEEESQRKAVIEGTHESLAALLIGR